MSTEHLLTQPPLPDAIRPLSNTESARLKARYPNLSPSPEKKCVTCRDRREYIWYQPNSRTETGRYRCDCVDQWVLNRYLLSSNIGLTYQRLGWADMMATEQGALDLAQEYLTHAEDYVANGIGLIFCGTAGTGKTSLGTLLLRDLLAQGYDGYFTTFSEMIDTYTGGWNDREERVWFHKRIKNAQVLVMDDVGKEYQGRKSSGLPESTFDEVLRHRVAASTPTIITTNLSLTRLQEGYGGGVMSLLRERSSTYRFDGQDYRDTQRHRTLDEIEEGLTRPVVLG